MGHMELPNSSTIDRLDIGLGMGNKTRLAQVDDLYVS